MRTIITLANSSKRTGTGTNVPRIRTGTTLTGMEILICLRNKPEPIKSLRSRSLH